MDQPEVYNDNKAFAMKGMSTESGDAEKAPSVEVINASGHVQEVRRHFGFWSACSTCVTAGNVWCAFAGSIVVAIYNGGPPGVIYEFTVDSIFYLFIAASLAELASAIPSSGGIYHWASITAGRYGRPVGWFAGWWNYLTWTVGTASAIAICAYQVLAMYAVMHPGYIPARWNLFITFQIICWISCAICLFFNRSIPKIELFGGFMIVAGVLVTIIVCAVMPYVNGVPYATSSFVWSEWENATGYPDGFAFLLGMLNGAFAVGTPDMASHLAEELEKPSIAIPKTIITQQIFGFFSCLAYQIAIFYAVNDLGTVLSTKLSFPIGEIYRQATGSKAGCVCLLLIAFLPSVAGALGAFFVANRTFWALSRDNAPPFAPFFAKINQRYRVPSNAIALTGVMVALLGCILLSSQIAFNALVGSFVILSTLSYLAAILPHLLHGRKRINPGWFWMKGATGFIVNGVSSVYIIVSVVIFCFPFSLPVTAAKMNYSVLIVGGSSIFITAWWFWRQADYEGPKHIPMNDKMAEEII